MSAFVRSSGTGLGQKAGPGLRECSRLSQAEVVSNSRI